MKGLLRAISHLPFSLIVKAGIISLLANAYGQEETIASFESPESTEIWRSVNDNVMGGISRGSFTHTKQGTLRLKGSLSLQNGGGFASIRTVPRDMNLGGATGIVVKACGDGRTYRVQLRNENQFGLSSNTLKSGHDTR